MAGLTIIRKEDLIYLQQLYDVDKPLHVVTTVAIGHFIERFAKKPEWSNGKVQFLSVNDSWKDTGTFVMINTNDSHILFDTLEPHPHESLRRTLELVNYDKPMVFICFRDIFRPVVLDVIRVQNLETTFDSGTRAVYRSLHHVDINTKIDPPDGYYLDDLKQCHVEKVNSTWPQRYSGSHDFLSNCIEHNPSTGLFNKETGELVAWILMLETGATGHLLVDDRYRRQRFGQTVLLAQGVKTRKIRCDNVGFIVHQNKASQQLTNGLGVQWIDNLSWIGIRPKKSTIAVPLWGHL